MANQVPTATNRKESTMQAEGSLKAPYEPKRIVRGRVSMS